MNGTEILEAFKAGNLHEAEEKVFETYNRLAALVIEGKKQLIAQGYLGEAEEIDEEDLDEDEQLDELSKATLGSYAKKATGEIRQDSWNHGNNPARDINRKLLTKIKKRQSGVEKAIDKLTREENELDETAYDSRLDDKKKIVVTGVMGARSKPFKKSFPNMKAFERWSDTDAAGDYEVHHVVNEDTLDELDRQAGGILDRYTGKVGKRFHTGEKLSDKRKEGFSLAGKKRWGDSKYGLPEPKVKGVERHPVVNRKPSEMEKARR